MSTELERQLEQANQKLIALKVEYDELVDNISHDISAPLRQIDGFVEIVLNRNMDVFDDKTQRHFALIQEGSNKAKSILDAAVGYSRLDRMMQEFTQLDLNCLLLDVKSTLLNAFDETQDSITFAKLPIILGEKKQITQVFEHLLHNALTYKSPERNCKINIDVIELDDLWQFSIADNGVGLSENIQQKIFKVLRRGVSDKTAQGMGMGLAIVEKILRYHDGSIWLESEKGKGSCFHFTISKKLNNEVLGE